MRRVQTRRLVLTMMAVVVCASCSSEPAAPTATSILGSWVGTVTDATYGTGKVTILVRDRLGSLVNGTWEFQFPSGAVTGGTFGGNNFGSAVTLYLNPQPPLPCVSKSPLPTYSASLTMSGNKLTGQWIAATCHQGSLDLTKQ
jgi:hypothetical protein